MILFQEYLKNIQFLMSSIRAQIEMGMPNVLPGTDVHIFVQCINLPQSGDV